MFCRCQPDDDDPHHFDALSTPTEKIIKIAILGPSGCGKTTIIKQLKQISGSLDKTDIINMTSYIKEHIVFNMKQLCLQSILLAQQCNSTTVNKNISHLRDKLLSLRDSDELTTDISITVRELLLDKGIQNTLKQRHCFQIDENIDYFFNKIDEISRDEYVPSFEDYVRVKRRSSGFCPVQFMKNIPHFGRYYFELFDVGGAQTERKKWWNQRLLLNPQLNAIVYIVPISDYNLALFEDNKTNRLIEAIHLFKDLMIKGDFFERQSIYLVFNKYDVFVQKIKTVPITYCFDDFPDTMNACDADDVLKFIASKFVRIFEENDVDLEKPLRIRRITAVNTDSVESVFDKIIPQIIQQTQGVVLYTDSDSDTSN